MQKKSQLISLRWLRIASQIGFAGFILFSSFRHSTSEEMLPSIDAYCPFGGIETLWQWVTTGQFIAKTHGSNLVLAIGLLLGVLVVGGAFCGWICPLGALQELLDAVRRRLRLPTVEVPKRLDQVLGYGRYAMLLGILLATQAEGKLWFADYDPYRTFFGLGWIFEFNPAEQWPAYLVTLLVIGGALFIPRVWCRYACPLGGLISLLQRVSLLRVRRDPAVCIRCGKCSRACPMQLPVATSQDTTAQCIGCLQCIEACPKAGALDICTILPRPKDVSQEVTP